MFRSINVCQNVNWKRDVFLCRDCTLQLRDWCCFGRGTLRGLTRQLLGLYRITIFGCVCVVYKSAFMRNGVYLYKPLHHYIQALIKAWFMLLAPHDVHLCYELQTGNIKQCTRQSCSCTAHYCHTANTRLDSTARGRLAFNAANLHVKRGPVPTLCCQRGNKLIFE